MLFLSLATALNSPLRVEPMGVVLPLGGPRLRDPGLRIVSNDGTEGHDIDFFIYLSAGVFTLFIYCFSLPFNSCIAVLLRSVIKSPYQ